MTSNQINYAVHLENVRHNVQQEGETKRSNLAREAETNRSNLVNEGETKRHNLAQESETKRHNLFGEDIATNTLEETKRSNRVREAETARSNRANEQAAMIQAGARLVAAQAAQRQAGVSESRLFAEEPLIKAQTTTEHKKAINFGSSTALNMQKRNESRAATQNMDARTRTENQQRLPNTIRSWVSIGTEAIKGVASGVKLFGG